MLIIKNSKNPSTELNVLKAGSVFRYKNNYYMKLGFNSAVEDNVVRLENGLTTFIDKKTFVHPVKCELNIITE